MSIKSVRNCISEFHLACRDIGFLAISGHCISKELCSDVLHISREFFSLPMEEKNRIHLSKYNNCTGYQCFGENVTGGKRDKHEGLDYFRPSNAESQHPFNIGSNPWPSNPSHFASIAEEYVAECLVFGDLLASALALSLKLDANHFKPYLNDSFWNVRFLNYATKVGVEDGSDLEYGEGCGEHRDYGCFTFVNSDSTVGCLQVRNANGEYITLDPIEDCFAVNLGDMLHLLTGGFYQSTPHRVQTPLLQNVCPQSLIFNEKRNGSEIGRISVPFFYDPNWDAVIEPVELDMNDVGWDETDREKYCSLASYRESCKPKMYGDHIYEKVTSNYSLMNVTENEL